MIRHTVVFSLKHPEGSAEEKEFLKTACTLAAIPGVENFECLRQVGQKNTFTFGLSMEFSGQVEYQNYNSHPNHVAFVNDRWLVEVEDFLEIDYAPIQDL